MIEIADEHIFSMISDAKMAGFRIGSVLRRLWMECVTQSLFRGCRFGNNL